MTEAPKAAPTGALNVERRTWDLDHFEKVARDRLEKGSEVKKPGFVRKREEFQSAEEGAAGPEGSKRAYLKPREEELGLDSDLGKVKVVTNLSAPHQQGGYWCDVCQCLLKDSMSYLDHINGKKHQRALGFSMRVERVGVDKVRDRIMALKHRAEAQKNAGPKEPAIQTYEKKLEQGLEAERIRREQLKEMKRLREKEVKEAEAEGEGGEEGEVADPEMMATMGFGGFK